MPNTANPLARGFITPEALRAMLADGDELAVIDTREQGIHAEGHLLLAASLPLSHLELEAPARLPRKDVRIVLIDDLPERAGRAADLLHRGGYTGVMLLEGGNSAWTEAGYQLFSGLYVPSKAFGEYVEHAYATPRIRAQDLLKLREGKLPFRLLDSRPMSEVADFSLPGALACPGAELVARASGTDAEVPIVVNCAGRTRGIIGAQSLINAGLPNPVYALENGTMGWLLDGLPLDHGPKPLAPLPGAGALVLARERALQLMRKHGVELISEARLAEMRAEPHRTTWLFDVRLPEIWQDGHRADAVNAPGGQLVQSTDQYAPVRNGRIVLVDDDLVQAPLTAHWLAQMGWDVAVLHASAAVGTVAHSGAPATRLFEAAPTTALAAAQLAARIADGKACSIDCRDSRDYRKSRIPGSHFAIRSEFAEVLASLPHYGTLTFISEDGILAAYAAADAEALGFKVDHLAGGFAAWVAAGMNIESGPGHYLSETNDAWYSPYQVESGREDAMRAYIAWETGLLDRLADEPGLNFRIGHA